MVAALAALLLSAAPAAADPARPTNVGSHVTGITPATDAITVDLLGANAFLQLHVRPGTAVTVMGYESEPYLRIDADGTVEENVNSKATYLNRTLTGTVDIPPTAGPTATPDWRRGRRGRHVRLARPPRPLDGVGRAARSAGRGRCLCS